jgi:hypothetical protein
MAPAEFVRMIMRFYDPATHDILFPHVDPSAGHKPVD